MSKLRVNEWLKKFLSKQQILLLRDIGSSFNNTGASGAVLSVPTLSVLLQGMPLSMV
jgi:hypothetical protein